MSAASVERVSSPNHFAELQLSGIEQSTLSFIVEAGELIIIRYNFQSTLQKFWVVAMIPLLM